MRFLRLVKAGHIFLWPTEMVTYLEINGSVTIEYLQKRLVNELKELVADAASFVHRPLLPDDDTIQVNGIKELLHHLEQRDADRHFLIGWLSQIHKLGGKLDVFHRDFKMPSKQPTDIDKLASQSVNTEKEDEFFSGIKIHHKFMKARRTYGLNK